MLANIRLLFYEDLTENYRAGILISRPADSDEFGSKPLYLASSTAETPSRWASVASVSPDLAFTTLTPVLCGIAFGVVGRE